MRLQEPRQYLLLLLPLLIPLLLSLPATAELDFLGNYSYGSVFSVSSYGDTIYYGSSGTLMVARLDDSDQLETLREIDFPNLVTSILLYDHYLLVGTQSGSTTVLDISDPESPVLSGNLTSPYLYASVIAGDLMVTAFSESGIVGMKIYDLSNGPLAATELSSWDLDTVPNANGATAIGVNGSTLFYSRQSHAGSDELVIMDISTPSDPVHLNTLGGFPSITQITPAGQHLYLNTWSEGLIIMDITNPSEPTHVGEVDQVPGAYLSLDGSRGLLAGGDQVTSLAFSDPTQPTILTTINLPAEGLGIHLAGNRFFGPTGYLGLMVGLVSLSGGMTITDQTQIAQSTKSIAVQGSTAYIGEGMQLKSFDVSDSQHPLPISSLTLPDPPTMVSVKGSIAAVATGDVQEEKDHLIHFIDVSDPERMEIMSSFPIPYYPARIQIRDGFAYLAVRTSGFIILDISDPTFIDHVATFSGWISDVFLQEGKAFVTDLSNSSIMIIDISNPNSPTLLTTYTEQSLSPFGVAMVENTAYIAGHYEIRVIDFQDIFNPVIISTLAIDPSGFFPIISDNILYTTWGIFLRHFDISDPNNLTEIVPPTPLWGGPFAVENSRVYLPCIYGGFFIFRDLASLTFSDGFETGDLSNWSVAQP